MNRYIKKSTAIAYIIGTIAVLLMLGVWPYGVIHKTYETGSAAFNGIKGKIGFSETTAVGVEVVPEGIIESESSNEEHKYMQVFVSDGTKFTGIDIWVSNDVSGQMLDFDIYDGEFKSVFHQAFIVDENTEFPGYVSISLRPELGVGVPYIFTLYSEDGDIVLGLEDHYASVNTSVYPTNFDGMEDEAHNIVCRMRYSVLFTGKKALIIDLIIALIAGLLIVAELGLFGVLRRKEAKPESDAATKVGVFCDKPVRVGNILIGVVVVLALISLIMVWPVRYWGEDVKDIIFSDLSILMLAGLLIYIFSGKSNGVSAENTERSNRNPADIVKQFVSSKSPLSDRVRAFITSAAIGVILWYCAEYMNGLFDIEHAYSARRILITFFVMLITTYSREELINIFNAIWLVIGIPIGIFYAKPYKGVPELEMQYKLSAWALYVGGFVLINVIRTIAKLLISCRAGSKLVNSERTESSSRAVRSLFLPYAIPCAVFFIGLVVLANTRWWPAYLAVMMALLVFRLAVWEDASKWIKFLCDGILLNFAMMVIFSLHHRPYHTYIYHRYNMYYYTVTMTATHLTMSLAAAATRLFIRYREIFSERNKGQTTRADYDKKDTGMIRRLIPDMMIFGAVACYAIFTLSRTAYAAIIVMIATMLIAAPLIYSEKKNRIRDCGICIAAMIIATAFMFPVTFSATRMIPATFDDPVIYAYEPASGTIYKGTAANDERYMNIHRFIEVFNSKVLNNGDTITDAGDVIPGRGNKKDVFVQQEQILLAAADIEAPEMISDTQPSIEGVTQDALLQLASADGDAYGEDEPQDATNGRLDIFRCYIQQSNLWGHDTMGAILDDGEESAHAHNIYLQAIFDHGWIFGIYFALFLAFSWLISVIRARRSSYALLIPVLLTGFMTAGMAEWIFHPCNPFGLAVCMAIVSMVFKDKV